MEDRTWWLHVSFSHFLLAEHDWTWLKQLVHLHKVVLTPPLNWRWLPSVLSWYFNLYLSRFPGVQWDQPSSTSYQDRYSRLRICWPQTTWRELNWGPLRRQCVLCGVQCSRGARWWRSLEPSQPLAVENSDTDKRAKTLLPFVATRTIVLGSPVSLHFLKKNTGISKSCSRKIFKILI